MTETGLLQALGYYRDWAIIGTGLLQAPGYYRH